MSTTSRNRSPILNSCAFVLAALCLLSVAPALTAPSPDLVISQVFGGGGNSGAPLTNDFIEIFNRGSAPVSLGGKSLQYASATGTGNFGVTNQITVLPNVTLNPGQYFLVQEAGGTAGAPLPVAADLVSSPAINMSGTGGKVAIVNSTSSLGCNGGSTPCSAAQLALIVDRIGYDGANFFEGSAAAPALTNTTAAFRAAAGCTDTDNNGSDFAAAPPAPRNSLTAAHACDTSQPTPPAASGSAFPASVSAGETVILSVAVSPGTNPASTGITVAGDLTAIGGSAAQAFTENAPGVFSFEAIVATGITAGAKALAITVRDAQDRTGTTSMALTVTPPIPVVTIHDIQGPGTFSPLANQLVQTEGIVTAVKSNGFFVQVSDAEVDSDPNTSEAVFVFTGSAPPSAATVGNRVNVRGRVQDFVPSSDPFSPPVTEIAGPVSLTAINTGNALPATVSLTPADLDPAGSITQLSKYEGMRVSVATLTVVAPTQGFVNEANATSTSSGVFVGVLPGTPRPFREPGIEAPAVAPSGVPQFDGNPERLRVDTDGQIGAVPIDVSTGASVSNLVGVLDFGARTYTLLPDPLVTPIVSGNDAHATPVRSAAGEGEVTVASFNLERFYDTVNDPGSDVALTAAAFETRLGKASLAIRNVLRLPDIIGVEEMEHLTTLQALAARIDSDAAAAGQTPPGYQAYLFEGNDVGGIDVGLLVKAGRIEVSNVEQVGKDATYVQPDGTVDLLNDRPPLVMTARVTPQGKEVGLTLTVIVNHLRSLNGIDDPIDGARVRAKRFAQAEFLATLIDTHQLLGESVVSVGDYNAFDVNDGYVDVINTVRGGTPHPGEDVLGEFNQLVTTPLIDLAPADPAQHYSYVFGGNAQVLDHIIVSQTLTVNEFTYARNDADFPEVLRGDATRPERISDHDVPVAYLAVLRDTVPPVVTLSGVTEGAAYLLGTVPTVTCSTTDALSGVATAATSSVSGGDANGVGQLTATCSGAVDKLGNAAAPLSVHFSVNAYAFGGFEPPLDADFTARSGSTVPVKFRIRDWNGNVVTSTSVITGIKVARIASCASDVAATWTDTTATGGTALRFDATTNEFIYNWKTTGVSAGCYLLGVSTADTLVHATTVAIR